MQYGEPSSMTEAGVPTAGVKPRNYPSLKSLVAWVAIITIVILFLGGHIVRFYASFLFFFYSIIGVMWVSVVFLGVFQTLLMIPVRIVNLRSSGSTEQMKEAVQQQDTETFYIKQQARKGNTTLLWYTVNFILQLSLYISIGRLFLIDFYSVPLNPEILYSWVPYPDYPIEGLIYKIPYIAVADTTSFGFRSVLVAWAILLVLQVLIYAIRMWSSNKSTKTEQSQQSRLVHSALAFTSGSTLILMVGAWFLLTHFPTELAIRIFSGDISIPNPRFNAITAVATFFTIVWLDTSKLRKQALRASYMNLSRGELEKMQRDRFRTSLINGALIGAGAFFITNQIPSAFELSIFTFEVISWFSPLTLDRFILAGMRRNEESKAGEGEMPTGL